MFDDARQIVTDLLHPQDYDTFMQEIVGQRFTHIHEGDSSSRAALLGNDPAATILADYEQLSPTITCHSGSSKQMPPTARRVGSADEFRSLIGEFHARGYTVRIPEVTGLSGKLEELCRALEIIFETPSGPGIFWSAAGADAPVHHDEVDLICIQLSGKKRWYISNEAPSLPNMWKAAGAGAPDLGRHAVFDVVPGDVVYMPRGTAHTVQSTTESIHVSIGIMPVTLREAMAAAVDYLSESDRSLRAGITSRADDLARCKNSDEVLRQLRRGFNELLARCQSDEFLLQAMQSRRARMVEDLPKLPRNNDVQGLAPDSRVFHHPLAMSQVISTGQIVDFRQPGERILVHPGVEEAIRFIVGNREFTVRDIPGPLGDDVKMALVGRFLTSGFLVFERPG